MSDEELKIIETYNKAVERKKEVLETGGCVLDGEADEILNSYYPLASDEFSKWLEEQRNNQ